MLVLCIDIHDISPMWQAAKKKKESGISKLKVSLYRKACEKVRVVSAMHVNIWY